MPRIFLGLATVSVLLILFAGTLGLTIGELSPADGSLPDDAVIRWKTMHLLTGVAAALFVVLVESIVVTYFVGASRWCKEVVETYPINHQLAVESARLKRRTFPWAVIGMLTMLGVVSLGAAGDPATNTPGGEDWALAHFFGAFFGLALVLASYHFCFKNICAQQQVLEKIVAEVQRIRTERGLDSEEPS